MNISRQSRHSLQHLKQVEQVFHLAKVHKLFKKISKWLPRTLFITEKIMLFSFWSSPREAFYFNKKWLFYCIWLHDFYKMCSFKIIKCIKNTNYLLKFTNIANKERAFLHFTHLMLLLLFILQCQFTRC